jgi:hypothetical protein
MAHESLDASDEAKQKARQDHRRAALAMMRLIALREPHEYKTPNLDPESYEGSLRLEVFRTQHNMLQEDPNAHEIQPVTFSLAETMLHPHLIELAQPGRPLTRERLHQIDPKLEVTIDSMERKGIGWPDDDTVFHDVLPEDFDDHAFGRRLVESNMAYNNYPGILSAAPALPDDGENSFDFLNRTRLYQYATKPYLIRAHELLPDFMGTLQRTIEQRQYPMEEWRASLQRAVLDEHPDPDDQLLLRASRLAYQLLINLMRKDDLQTQAHIMTMSSQRDITDPVVELWT